MVCDHRRFDRGRLQLLLEDRLAADAEAGIIAHLEVCQRCRRELEAIAAGPSWWAEARTFLAETPPGGLSPPNPWHALLEPSDREDAIGRLDKYDVVELVGRGGMGVVLKAVDGELNRLVALKVLAPEWASSADARRRFLREAQAAAAVVHPNIIPIYAIGSAGDIPYLVMPHIAGESLQARIEREGALDPDDVVPIAVQVAAGLAAAHAHGLVHRDIKPANILLEEETGRVYITDFGLARAVDNAALTRTGAVAGTPHYMSPEQAEGGHVDHRSDLFSLGSLLYAMCTGRSPFRADGTLAVLRRICDVPHRPARDVNPEVPESLSAIIDRLLAKRPDDRYASADEVASALVGAVCRTGPGATCRRRFLPLSGPIRQTGPTGLPLLAITAITTALLVAFLLLPARNTPIPEPSPIRAIGGSRLAESFSFDFRGEQYDPSLFFPLNVDSFYRVSMLRPARDGLRVVVPHGPTQVKTDVTFAPMLAIHGDFEITASYELVQVDPPAEGDGIGAAVYLCARGSANAAKLCRYVCPGGRQQYFAFAAIRDPAGDRAGQSQWFPATGRWGRLRIERTGSALQLLAAEEGSEEFRPLYRIDRFGPGPVDLVRLEATAQGARTTTEILWKDLEIRAKKLFLLDLPALRTAKASQPPR